MKTTPEGEMHALGFVVGTNVRLLRKITAEFKYDLKGKPKTHRADIEKNTVVVIGGFHGESPNIRPVIRVEHICDGVNREVMYKLKKENIERYKPSGPVDHEPPKKKIKRNKEIEYVTAEGTADDEILHIKDWTEKIDKDDCQRNLNKTVLRLGMCVAWDKVMKQYQNEDITIIKRNGAKNVECYANKDFKPNALMLVAETSEMKDLI